MLNRRMIGAMLFIFVTLVALAVAAMVVALWWEGWWERVVVGAILVIFVILALAVAVVAVALWWLPPVSTGRVYDRQTRPLPSSPEPPYTNPTTATLERPTTSVNGVASRVEREFADRADRFGGLYESLHMACTVARDADECREVLSEWEVRLTNISGEALQQKWRDVVREATGLSEFGGGEAANDEAVFLLGARWRELLSSWGMERDERTTFVLEEDEKRRYRISGDRQVGEQLEVELPCWTYKGEVIERGIARTVAAPG